MENSIEYTDSAYYCHNQRCQFIHGNRMSSSYLPAEVKKNKEDYDDDYKKKTCIS